MCGLLFYSIFQDLTRGLATMWPSNDASFPYQISMSEMNIFVKEIECLFKILRKWSGINEIWNKSPSIRMIMSLDILKPLSRLDKFDS